MLNIKWTGTILVFIKKFKEKGKGIECFCFVLFAITVMWCSTMRVCPEKCVVRQFCHCETIIECTNLDGRAYYTQRLCSIA